jgi:uncharacterized protein involved in exopolysaccharide biosynthesis
MEKQFDLMPYILVFVRRRKAILFHCVLIIIVAWLYAFLVMKKEFMSEMIFLPPTGENTSISGLLPGIALPSISSADISPEQINTVFASKALKRKIIEKFNLYDHYKMRKNQNKFENTLKQLNKCLMLQADEKGTLGFSKTLAFSLSAYHTSADTAYQMDQYAFSLLDSAVKAISSDRARRNRIFVEAQLEKNKSILDSLQKAMQEFQVSNKAYNIPEQAKMAIKAYADLKATMLANDVRIQVLKNEFSGETPELAALQKSNRAFEEKLTQIETDGATDAMPSLETSAKLLPQYTNLMRDVEVQNQLIVFIAREVEQAKLKEAKNISGLIVSDPAFVPEYKARPKRIMIIAIIAGVYMLFIFGFITLQEMYRVTFKNSPFIKEFWASVKSLGSEK